jgi:uncharacterized spore protein YtfJ
MGNEQLLSVLDKLDAVKDTLNVRRVFGDAYEVGSTTIIPVARVQGGGGGGGGVGPTDGNGSSAGSGVGFGIKARPVGVYIVKDDQVSWQPALDQTRVILAGQLVAVVAILTARKLLRRR